ncbi:MAG: hypothetical protein WBD07_13240 [Vicinamibacterales bacterium]
MTARTRIAVVGALLLALIGGWASAQILTVREPVVLSGGDIGFQVDSQRGGVPVGKIVVRVDGKWVEAQLSTGIKRLPN